MASFYGRKFSFDGRASDDFGLIISTFDSGTSDGNGGSDPTLYQKWVIDRTKVYYYGRSLNTALQLEITITSEEDIDASSRSLIQKWLTGRSGYLPLVIEQEDLYDITFNVMFTKCTPKYIGNQCIGFNLSGVCDSPFAYEYPRTLTKSYSGSAMITETFNYMNTSDHDGYLYPSVLFHTAGAPGGSECNISITNHTDGSRVFSFTGLSGSEILSVDNDRGIIVSSTSLLRMDKFTSKKFFRLVPGNNNLTISGSLVSFQMSIQNARKVGG